MGSSNKDGQFEIKQLPIVGQYDVQRFLQFSPEDAANWYVVKGRNTKRSIAMYPTMGRARVRVLGFNQLIFNDEPRAIFKSIKFSYVVVGNAIFRVDDQYNLANITTVTPLVTLAGPVYFAFLVINTIVFSCFVDEEKVYIYREDTGQFSIVTDGNAPGNIIINGKPTKPGFIAAFGNRIGVSVKYSSQFFLSVINLLDSGGNFDPATCFFGPGAAVFAQENGIIGQMGVLNNQLYIFTDYTTGIWSNTPAVFSGTQVSFPWKKNSTYDWNFGIANPSSLDIDFGRMVFLARNSDGLLQFMLSMGDQPNVISTKAIDTLLQNYTNDFGGGNPFLLANSNGFLYQYENTIFYRMSGGAYNDLGILDQEIQANSIEFNFEIQDWHRCIEVNGERNRIQFHTFFNFKHLVSIVGDSTVYEMAGKFYFNESRNPDQPNPQAPDSYLAFPFRYERITPIICEDDYSEFETEYVEIDFVFGDSDINFSTSPFINANFLISEDNNFIVSENNDSDNQPVFVLGDNSNTPSLPDKSYNNVYKPTVELYFSDDGGILFKTADVREFSQMGVYSWRMRWYQLGPSRNRVYKLIAVSPVPIVILGGVMNVRRVSGGAN